MLEPTLNYVTCTGPAKTETGTDGRSEHRMAYWEWNATGDPAHPHVIFCVHGLTRQGRDFDVLARALAPYARLICPDVAGRGHSDWLADPRAYAVPQYAMDMLALLHQVQLRGRIGQLDWVGTSMGGLIGMCLAGEPQLPLPAPIRRLVLNDVGPTVEWAALQRISAYVGQPVKFTSVEQAAAALRIISSGFGPHTDAEWLALTAPMLKPLPEGGLGLHYDPAIGESLRAMSAQDVAQGQAIMWQLYERITAQTLLLRGEQSDLVSVSTAEAMQHRGPRAQCVTLANVGHAPTLVAADQVKVVQDFLLGKE